MRNKGFNYAGYKSAIGRALLFFALGIFMCQNTIAQQQPPTYARVILTNGALVKGYVGKSIDNDHFKIIFPGDSSYEMHIRIDMIKKLEFRKQRTARRVAFVDSADSSQPGIFHSISFGVMVGENNVGISLANENGYRINDHFALGIGLNYDRYDQASALPIYVTARAYVNNKRVSPYYFVGAGYGFGWLNTEFNTTTIHKPEFRGGLYGQTGVGYEFLGKNHSVSVILGYRIQKSQLEYYYDEGIWSHPRTIEDFMFVSEKRMFRRAFIAVGASF